MGATDQMLARYVAEIEERQQFIDGIVEAAGGKDLTDEQVELVTETRNRISRVNELMKPLEEARKITGDSAERIRQLASYMQGKPDKPQEVEYRSAGAYVIDYWQVDDRQRRGDGTARHVQPGRRPPDHAPTTPACSRSRSWRRSSTSSTTPGRWCRRSGLASCRREAGRGRRSPSTSRSPPSRQRRPSSRRRR